MLKLVILFKRKPGMDAESFREYYETRHAPLAERLTGRFLTDYRRSYPVQRYGHAELYSETGSTKETSAAPTEEFDVITELWFANREKLDAFFTEMAKPEIQRIGFEDESAFLDRSSMRVMLCDEERSNLSVP
jgi:hypothetical protein